MTTKELKHARDMVAFYDHRINDLKSHIELAKFDLKDCRRVRRNWARKIKEKKRALTPNATP